MSTKNDLVLLNQAIQRLHADIAPSMKEDDYFEILTAEQTAKDYDLSYEELIDGNVGSGGRDGGVDGIYIFINGEYLQEDSDFSWFPKTNLEIHLIVLQAKNKAGFEEVVIDKLSTITDEILDLSRDVDELHKFYNSKLVESVAKFHKAIEQLAQYFPRISISYIYACKGGAPTENMLRKAQNLKQRVLEYFRDAEFNFEFYGASELLDQIRRQPKRTFELKLAENAIATEGELGFISLVRLPDYFDFITENGNLLVQLFEANVRDFQGRNSVNRQIENTLSENHDDDFWWLNNGITILATQAIIRGKAMQIENPEIVNGLQTSYSIYQYFRPIQINKANDNRSLLVRVVVPTKVYSRERIIKATNSQTKIPDGALRGLDKIHRDIEDFLLNFQIYYDRRKNYYKNQRKQVSRIISIKQMAQSVMSIVLQKPDDARGRPNDLLQNDDIYIQVFDTNYDLKVYLFCISLYFKVEDLLKSNYVDQELDYRGRSEIKYHAMMYIVLAYMGKYKPTANDIAAQSLDKIGQDFMIACINEVIAVFIKHGATNRVAKGKELLEELLTVTLKNRLGY